MATGIGGGSGARTLATILAAVLALFVLAFAGVLAAVFGVDRLRRDRHRGRRQLAKPQREIPARYLALYRDAGHRYEVPWPVLAAIGSIETDHGRSNAPGVHSGVNRFGCCAGPMQFNVTDGPPSTWDRYAVDGNHDGDTDVYDPEDAIPSAGNYLRALLHDARRQPPPGDPRLQPLRRPTSTTSSPAPARTPVTSVPLVTAGMADGGGACTSGGIDLADRTSRPARGERRLSSPRAFRALPAWAMAAGRAPEPVDARLYDDVVWILRRYHLRVTAAREAGHHTHGDGTAVDLDPRRRHHAARLGRLRRATRRRSRLDRRVRPLRQPTRLPARARDPVRRLRRLPRPRLATHLPRAAARPTSTSRGPRPATEPAASPHRANGSPISRWRRGRPDRRSGGRPMENGGRSFAQTPPKPPISSDRHVTVSVAGGLRGAPGRYRILRRWTLGRRPAGACLSVRSRTSELRVDPQWMSCQQTSACCAPRRPGSVRRPVPAVRGTRAARRELRGRSHRSTTASKRLTTACSGRLPTRPDGRP